MPRKPRLLENGGLYHVFSRGNNRKKLFNDREDFKFHLYQLSEVKAIYDFDIYHYCLMTNHFHFLVQIKLAQDLPKIMHRLKLKFTRYYKNKYDFVGHLFQGRYKSPRIDKESYYLECGRYIERNPVVAGIVEFAERYEYSSAKYYVKGIPDELITTNPYYLDMGHSNKDKQFNYKNFLLIDDPYRPMVDEALMKI